MTVYVCVYASVSVFVCVCVTYSLLKWKCYLQAIKVISSLFSKPFRFFSSTRAFTFTHSLMDHSFWVRVMFSHVTSSLLSPHSLIIVNGKLNRNIQRDGDRFLCYEFGASETLEVSVSILGFIGWIDDAKSALRSTSALSSWCDVRDCGSEIQQVPFLTAGYSAWSNSQNLQPLTTQLTATSPPTTNHFSPPDHCLPGNKTVFLYVYNTCVIVHACHDKVSYTELWVDPF